MNNNNNGQLEKKLSPINVWSLALGCIIGWGAFVMPGNTFLGKAGPLGTAIAMGIAALIMIIIAFNYNFMINMYPVAGGEFTYTQKAFGEKHAFICSWFLGLSYLAIVPLNATALALIGRNLMNNIFQVGFHYNVAGYDIYFGEIILAVVALLLFAYLSIRGVKFTGVFQTGLVFALVGGVTIITIAAILSGKASWSNLSPAFYPNVSKLGGVLAVVAVAPWAFVGFDTIPQAAEEFKFSPKKTRMLMVLSIVFGAAVYIILNTVTAAVIPEEYTSWTEYIDNIGSLDGLISLPTFHAGYQLLGTTGVWFLGIAVLGAILSGIIGFYMATSRLLYSMAKEKVLPDWFGALHEKYKTPAHAILFVLAIALVAPFFGRNALGWIVDMSSIGAAIGYGYTSLKTYYLAKIIRKLRLSSFYKCDLDKTARTSVGCSLAKVKMGRYSYTGAGCHITDATIGNFCSIGGGCGIGGGIHPIDHASTSPVFLKGRNIMKTNFANFPYVSSETVKIGNDVWIGDGVFIKSGVHVGDGAIIGAHAVVVKDVEPYSVVAGVPAKEIRKRFDGDTINQLMDLKWWDWSDEKLKENGPLFDDPKKLIESVT